MSSNGKTTVNPTGTYESYPGLKGASGFKTDTIQYLPGQGLLLNKNGTDATDLTKLIGMMNGKMVVPEPCNRDVEYQGRPSSSKHIVIANQTTDDVTLFVLASNPETQGFVSEEQMQKSLTPEIRLARGTSICVTLSPDEFGLVLSGVAVAEWQNAGATLTQAGGKKIDITLCGSQLVADVIDNSKLDPSGARVEIHNKSEVSVKTGIVSIEQTFDQYAYQRAERKGYDSPASLLAESVLNPNEWLCVDVPSQIFNIVGIRNMTKCERRSISHLNTAVNYNQQSYVQVFNVEATLGQVVSLNLGKQHQVVPISRNIPAVIFVKKDMVSVNGEFDE